MDFKKIQILAKNSKVLTFDFTEKCQFVKKTDQNSVFFYRDPHISDRLYLMVPYMGFCEFF